MTHHLEAETLRALGGGRDMEGEGRGENQVFSHQEAFRKTFISFIKRGGLSCGVEGKGEGVNALIKKETD